MFATIGATLYKSTNRGYTWNLSSSGLPNRTITSVYVHPDSSNVVLLTFSGFGVGKVYRSNNTGLTWTNISGNLPDTPVNDLLIYYPGYSTGSYIIATDVGVFMTQNYGMSWAELADDLPNTVAMHLDYHSASRKLRVGTHGRGVYETVLPQPVVSVSVPNGGETWTVGTNQTIQWSSSNLPGNVKIELSRNAGSTYETLFANTTNNGSVTWIASGTTTTQALIKITSIDIPTLNDVSDANFSIVNKISTQVDSGWTLLSLPLSVQDHRKSVLFPSAISDAFSFSASTNRYIVCDTLKYGEGYWLKFPTTESISISGEYRGRDTIYVKSGWNLIGSISDPVSVKGIIQIPNDIIIFPVYGYNFGYVQSDTIQPMRSYWIKFIEDGRIILTSP